MPAAKLQPVVYLPIELGVREFDSKVLLATKLVSRGLFVVIGQQWMLYTNMGRLPPGVFLFKSFNKIHHPAMMQARSAGHRVVLLEEELLGHTNEKAIAAQCPEGVFQIPHLILSNGKREHDVLRKLSPANVAIEITGNARIDVLKPQFRAFFEDDIARLHQRYGEYVLLNTNFGLVNSAWGPDQVMQIMINSGYYNPRDPDSVRMMQDYVEFEHANHAAVLKLIRQLAERHPGRQIVVRPHPGEDLARWNGAFPALTNITVIRDGSHVPWTLGSRVLLHTSCTTGFEAFVAGKLALSLVPRAAMISDSIISNQVNLTYDTADTLLNAAEQTLAGNPPAPKDVDDSAVEAFVWNYGRNSGVDRIAEHLAADLTPAPSFSLPPLQPFARDERLRAKFMATPQDCARVFDKAAGALGVKRPELHPIGDSLFVAAPGRAAAH